MKRTPRPAAPKGAPTRRMVLPHLPPKPKPKARTRAAEQIVAGADRTLLDVVDNLLNRGVVLTGDALLGVADIDLIYLKLSAVLCSADALKKPH